MGIHPTTRRGEAMGRGTGGTSVGTFDDRLYLPAHLHAWGKQRRKAAPEPSQTANKQATPCPSKVINQKTTTKRSPAADKQAAPGLSKATRRTQSKPTITSEPQKVCGSNHDCQPNEANVNSQMITTTRKVSRQQSSTGPSRSTGKGKAKAAVVVSVSSNPTSRVLLK